MAGQTLSAPTATDLGTVARSRTTEHLVVIAVVAFFISLPLANTLTLDVGFPLTIAHLLAALVAVLMLWRDRLRPRVVTWLPASLFAAFCATYTLSFIVNVGVDVPEYPWATGRFEPSVRSATKVLWLIGNVAIAVVMANAVRRTNSEGRAIRALGVGAVAAGLYGLYQVIGETHGFFVPLLPGTQFIEGTPSYWIVLRAKSTFLEPSFFGAFLAVTLPFIIVGWRPTWFRMRRGQFISAVMLTLAMAGILVTFAIGGWLPGAVGIAVLVALSARNTRWPLIGRLTICGSLAAMLVFAAIPDLPRAVSAIVYKGAIGSGVVSMSEAPYSQRPGASPTPVPTPHPDELPPEAAEISATERSATSSAALSMFVSSPLTGIGPGNFGFRYAEFRPDGVAEPTQLLIVNNIYAELLAESGLLGLVTFLGGLGSLGVLAVQAHRQEANGQRQEIGAGIAAMVAMAVSFLLSPTFTLLYQWSVLGLVAALVARTRESHSAGANAPNAGDHRGDPKA